MALQIYESEEDVTSAITVLLIGSFCSWLLLNLAFFSTIDKKYIKTFFSRKTAPEYTCELFKTSKEDSQRFDAAFDNRPSFTSKFHAEVKEWVGNNADKWIEDGADWLKSR